MALADETRRSILTRLSSGEARVTDVAAPSLGNPILNSPYEAPSEHFEIGPSGPTGTIWVGLMSVCTT